MGRYVVVDIGEAVANGWLYGVPDASFRSGVFDTDQSPPSPIFLDGGEPEDQTLYRDLSVFPAELNKLASEHSTLRVRVAELEAMDAALRIQLVALGVQLNLEQEITRSKDAHLAALEAPPVVPLGYSVEKDRHDGTWGLAVELSPAYPRSELCRAKAMRAGAWAIEHNARPPHESDGEVTP